MERTLLFNGLKINGLLTIDFSIFKSVVSKIMMSIKLGHGGIRV